VDIIIIIIIIIIGQQFRLGTDCFGKPNNFENLAHCRLLEINCANMLALGIIMVNIHVWFRALVGEISCDPLPPRFANSVHVYSK